MGWRTIIITGNAKLDYRLDYLVVRKTEGTARIHISEIEMLIIESTSVSLTTMLLSELTKAKVKVIFCDQKHNPSSELLPYYGSHDTSSKIKAQVRWKEDVKKYVWTCIVRQKIIMQRNHLIRVGKTKESEMLSSYIDELKPGDETNREGHAAKVYFNALFGMDFTRDANNSLNAALNYGYGVLLSHFTREIVSNGYLTQLGLFHDNIFNPFNLASDLMEPYRILVDRVVKKNEPTQFGIDEKQMILSLFNSTVLMDGIRREIPASIRVYCRSLFDVLNEVEGSKIQFYEDEL